MKVKGKCKREEGSFPFCWFAALPVKWRGADHQKGRSKKSTKFILFVAHRLPKAGWRVLWHKCSWLASQLLRLAGWLPSQHLGSVLLHRASSYSAARCALICSAMPCLVIQHEEECKSRVCQNVSERKLMQIVRWSIKLIESMVTPRVPYF